MKKIIFYSLTMVFALALGVSYALEGNGVTDFSGLTYDIGPAGIPAPTMEGESAGGMREAVPDPLWYNGVTDFRGKTVEEENISIEPSILSGEHAGGMREEAPSKELFNGVTDFAGFDSN